MHNKTQNPKRKKKRNSKTRKEKYQHIANQLQHISLNSITKEYFKLQTTSCAEAKKASNRIRLGNKIVDAFTFVERLHTKGHQNVSFYEFWENRKYYKQKKYIQKMLTFYENRDIDEIRKFKYIYNLYFSSITIFRPIMAMEIYCKVNATRVLDFTMGWGGRLVGACALGLEAYIGIDNNIHLREPYKKLCSFLESETESDRKTTIDLRFTDALTVDYSKMDYDCVFTSPPYYDLETYGDSDDKVYASKEDWNKKFYAPLFTKTFHALKPGGSYCLNIPDYIYEAVCLPLFGRYSQKISLKKGERKLGERKNEYREFIYIWFRP